MTIPEILQSSIAGIITESFFPVAQYPGFTHHAFVIPCLWRKTEDRSVDKRRDAEMDRADKHCHHNKQTARDRVVYL
jgi:hypothetical protein